ncbi:MAG: flagellar hook-basal body complex protein [Sulfuricurvum sp.]|nr:flagellar hook-basal body complex protein [Sulfuricurvum sp.]
MTQGFYSGLSGVQTHQYGIDVASDNLANVNTVGYRGSNTEFSSLLSSKIVSAGAQTPTSNDLEAGVRLQATTMNTSIGTFINTDRFADLSIGGNGWFGVTSALGNNNYFTRAGNFVFDEYQKIPGDGNSSIARLTTGDGMYVSGTMLGNYTYNPAAGSFVVTPANNVPLAAVNAQGPLELPTLLTYPAEPTTTTQFAGNLGFTPGVRTVNETVINALNEQNNLNLIFTKSTSQPTVGTAWDVAATLKSADNQTTHDIQSGRVVFADSGILLSSTLSTMDNNGTPLVVDSSNYFTNAHNLGLADDTRTMSSNVISANNDRNHLKLVFTQSAVQPATGVSWDIAATVTTADGQTTYDTQTGQATFGASGRLLTSTLPTMNNDGSPLAVDLSSYLGGITSASGVPISVSSQSDGSMGGTLTKYGISNDGTIIADFSNGRQSAIGRVAVYHFQNEQGLERNGGTMYTQSSNSGEPIFWTDQNGNTITGAKITSGQLENSNVRLDVGLTDMIILQRAYQANAKTITTVDEMIQKALQMRR